MYDRLTAPWPDTIEDFPPLGDTEKIEAEINTWFKPYIFYRRKSRGKYIEVWTSCCHRHEGRAALQRTMSAADAALLYMRHNDYIPCPFCGRKATVKSLGKGNRDNLTEYRPAVILRERDGDIYARAYWVKKTYTDGDDLAGAPLFDLVGAYRFTDGRARQYAHFYNWRDYNYAELDGKYDPKKTTIREPFTSGSWLWFKYDQYAVIGLDELDKSRFRYCGYAQYRAPHANDWCEARVELHGELMRYLAVCSIYPRQTEMLIKTGWRNIVSDMVSGARKNAAAFDWDSPAPGAAAFGLTKPEYRALTNRACRSTVVVAEYKRLKKAGLCRDINAVIDLDGISACLSDVRRACMARQVTAEKLLHYIGKQGAALPPQNGHARTLHWLLDYWDMAVMLGWNLANTTVLWPRDIKTRHDTAAEEITAKARREEEASAMERKAAAVKRLNAWRKKYNIEGGGYLIRIAEDEREITAEGAALEHCVAGYAQRHMLGQCTILFLRRCDAPDASLYTIEMRGNDLHQIHGYRNEHVHGTKMPDPQETMAWLLEPWLDWLKKGSPRDEDGTPKINIKKTKEFEEAKAS